MSRVTAGDRVRFMLDTRKTGTVEAVIEATYRAFVRWDDGRAGWLDLFHLIRTTEAT